ncbi:radical SAM/SPASM domain-containing protein [Methanonatronarchaeum sp. AMET6-2]|uniref:radical SAM/SPASM domain-containing protein n=1 Tax=Methanonatronarchaeum sp. AMET6-2 TaxID=2933293 RepID=UPI001201C584|nr:radical SAM protein [Methanonatronarchaeum sp. AMET6-2]RZN61283.1 MAG: radical SAM protein [Methanonatronarchaeia archaeon]UOY09714.1 radical SAM protein [Methanonatronarchaeum sp. AMET6-2]
MSQEFTAIDTRTVKLYITRLEDGSLEVDTKGFLSPFLGKLENRFEEYLTGLNSRVIDNQLHVSTGFPPIPSNAFSRMVKTEMKRYLGIHRPQNITIMVTDRCQCDCRHCLVSDMINQDKEQLETNEIKRTIDQALDLGVSQVLFEGGDPLLREDLPELVNHVDDRATTMVVTNGINLDRKKAGLLSDAGLNYLNFSLDSPYPDEHNEFRKNKSAYRGVMNGLKIASEKDILSAVLYVATPKNINRETIEDLIELCISKNVFELMIEEVVDTGNWSDKNTLTKQDKEDIKKMQQDLIKRDRRLLTRFYRLREPDCFGCFAGKRWVYISPGGEVMPCMHTPITFGNIKKNSLKSIWREIRKHSLYSNNKEECAHERSRYQEGLERIQPEKTPPYPDKYF